MATYHKSPVKQGNREFKLKYAKRALRTAGNKHLQVATLCGGSLWFEAQLAGYAHDKWGAGTITVNAFNNNYTPQGEAEWENVRRERMYIPINEVLGNQERYLRASAIASSIQLHRRNLSHMSVPTNCDFTDFDTCDWFFAANAEKTLKLCAESRMLSLTIILKGRHPSKDLIKTAKGLSFEDSCNPEKVGAWIGARANMRLVAHTVYKNPGSASTMATLILEKKEKPKADEKEHVRSLLCQGKDAAEVARVTGFPYRTVAAMKAWLAPGFKKMRKSF